MCTHHVNPFQCIIPPYIADKLAEAAGTDAVDVREVPPELVAEVTDGSVDRLRQKRQAISSLSIRSRELLLNVSNTADAAVLKQKIFDAGQLPILPGTLLWETGPAALPADQDARNVIEGGAKTWEFYKSLFNRNSINNKGMVISQSIHYREDPRKVFDNALWDGEQMIYGDGDGVFTGSFTSDIDIIAHELTHGVIDYTAKLTYRNQSGALNESFADIFGILVKQWSTNTSAKDSDWLVGKNVILGDEYALRSLKAPGTAYKNHPELGTDPQPAVMSDFKTMPVQKDFGGVHYNSGIPNFAFYVTANELGGFAWEKAGRIWYETLAQKGLLKKSATFLDLRVATLQKATELFGAGSLEVKAVALGWDTAEVN